MSRHLGHLGHQGFTRPHGLVMFGHAKLLLERGRIAINPKFHKLVTSLSTAVDNEGSLDKQLTSYSDMFDAFRLSLQNYYLREGR